jgi:hypothetical protein
MASWVFVCPSESETISTVSPTAIISWLPFLEQPPSHTGHFEGRDNFASIRSGLVFIVPARGRGGLSIMGDFLDWRVQKSGKNGEIGKALC